jgi:hypothetical protein
VLVGARVLAAAAEGVSDGKAAVFTVVPGSGLGVRLAAAVGAGMQAARMSRKTIQNMEKTVL